MLRVLKWTYSMRTKNTLFNLLIRETSQFLCYERLLNLTYVAYKNAFSRKMQFWSLCYTVVSYQAPFRLSIGNKLLDIKPNIGEYQSVVWNIRNFGNSLDMQCALSDSVPIKESENGYTLKIQRLHRIRQDLYLDTVWSVKPVLWLSLNDFWKDSEKCLISTFQPLVCRRSVFKMQNITTLFCIIL